MPVTPLCMADTMNPVEIVLSTVTICMKVPHLEQGTYDNITKQTQTLAMICEQYPLEAWTNVYVYIYTDGSPNNAIQDSGAGIAIYLPSVSTVAARYYSNYICNLEVLYMYALNVVNNCLSIDISLLVY